MLLLLALMMFSVPQQDVTAPPADLREVLTVDGLGIQIYRCTAQQNNAFKWVYEAPDAKLLDRKTHEQVGSHGAGPTWTWNDGSSISGKVLQTMPAKDASAIPWLLLETQPANDVPGVLAGVTRVRRSETQAGVAPATGCDAENVNNTVHVPYAAVYTFYAPAK